MNHAPTLTLTDEQIAALEGFNDQARVVGAWAGEPVVRCGYDARIVTIGRDGKITAATNSVLAAVAFRSIDEQHPLTD